MSGLPNLSNLLWVSAKSDPGLMVPSDVNKKSFTYSVLGILLASSPWRRRYELCTYVVFNGYA